jgi:hypothetical protein
MKICIAIAVMLSLATPARCGDLGNRAPLKAPSIVAPNVPDPSRQGGDTFATAFVIPSLPYFDTGTTTGYTNDYDAVCPFDGNAPDVVYSYRPLVDEAISVDLCGSSYDTKTYIYDDTFDIVACNDDYYDDELCGEYRSKIEHADLAANRTYYIVVDGYGSAHGDYILAVAIHELCELACPAGGVAEGEPTLHDDYVDTWNGGCQSDPFQPVFQPIIGDSDGEAVLCGVSGWYTFFPQDYRRDTDWFTLVMGPTGTIEATIDGEIRSQIFELRPQECDAVDVFQYVIAECGPATMEITGYAPGAVVWLWAGSTYYAPPGWGENEYDYVLWFTGLESSVAIERTTWSTVKALYE